MQSSVQCLHPERQWRDAILVHMGNKTHTENAMTSCSKAEHRCTSQCSYASAHQNNHWKCMSWVVICNKYIQIVLCTYVYSTFTVLLCILQLPTNTNNNTIKEIGCSWLVCLQLIFELRYDATIRKIRAASDFRHSVHRHLFCSSNSTRWGSLRFAPMTYNILSCYKVHSINPAIQEQLYGSVKWFALQ